MNVHPEESLAPQNAPGTPYPIGSSHAKALNSNNSGAEPECVCAFTTVMDT
jgi:hypothetical protein